MILNKMLPFQTVSVAIIQQFSFHKEIFPLLFSDKEGATERFARIDTVDTDWFDDESFRKYLFGNDSDASASGNICRYGYQAAHLEFGDERDVKKLGIGTNYFVNLDERTSEERQVSFRFTEWNLWFWKNGTGYISCNISLNCKADSEQRLVMQDVALFVELLSNHSARRSGNISGNIGQGRYRNGRFSFKDILYGSSTNTNLGAEKLGVVPMIKKLCSHEDIEIDISMNETKRFYFVYAVSDGVVNGRVMNTDDINQFISLSEFRQMIAEANFPENTTTDEKVGKNRKNIDNHYWSIGEKGLICLGYKDRFLLRGGLWKNIYSNYMILYQYFQNIYDECSGMKDDLMENFDTLNILNQRLSCQVLNPEVHGHIQDLFHIHLCKNVWNLGGAIRKMQKQIRGNNFALQSYLDRLPMAESHEDAQLELDLNTTDDPFIFISYAHADFKDVYNVLARLYKEGMNFWYDRGLEAGEHWTRMVRGIIASPNCVGAIFFISENFFRHPHTLEEAVYVRKKGVKSFSINLNNTYPTEILRKILQAPEISGFDIKTLPDWFNLEQISKILYCFNNGDTYIGKDFVENDLFNTIKQKGWKV